MLCEFTETMKRNLKQVLPPWGGVLNHHFTIHLHRLINYKIYMAAHSLFVTLGSLQKNKNKNIKSKNNTTHTQTHDDN